MKRNKFKKVLKCVSSSVSAEGYDVSDRCDPQGGRGPGCTVRVHVTSRRLCGAEIKVEKQRWLSREIGSDFQRRHISFGFSFLLSCVIWQTRNLSYKKVRIIRICCWLRYGESESVKVCMWLRNLRRLPAWLKMADRPLEQNKGGNIRERERAI